MWDTEFKDKGYVDLIPYKFFSNSEVVIEQVKDEGEEDA